MEQFIDGDFQHRWDIVKHLPTFGTAAIAPLLDLLQDDALEWEVRWFAARALGQFQHAGTQPTVLAALLQVVQTTTDEDLRTAAAIALGQFGHASVAALTQLMEQPEQRLLAVQTLASIPHAATLPPLLTAATDPHPTVRAVAITGLGNLHPPASTDAGLAVLLPALQDGDAGVRQATVVALGRWAERQPLPALVHPLVSCLWDVSLPVCQAAARALGRLDLQAARLALTQVLFAPHTPEPLHLTVVRALSWQLQPATLNALVAAWEQAPTAVQLEIIAILGQQDTPALQQQARIALGDWLQRCLHDPTATQLKQALALALGQVGDGAARSLLVQLCTTASESVQVYAAAALRQLDGDR